MGDVPTLDLSVESGAAAVAATTLTIIIPTLNERDRCGRRDYADDHHPYAKRA